MLILDSNCSFKTETYLTQLRKEGRKSEYERHKLQALNQRQKMVSTRTLLCNFESLDFEYCSKVSEKSRKKEDSEVCNSQVLQRKTEEAAMATKRLKELLEARKSSPRDHSGMEPDA